METSARPIREHIGRSLPRLESLEIARYSKRVPASVIMSSRTITVFSETADSSERSICVLGSILIHGLALASIGYGIMYKPTIVESAQHERYSVRRLDFSIPTIPMHLTSKDDEIRDVRLLVARVSATANRMAAAVHLQRSIPTGTRHSYTLVQADLTADLHDPSDIKVPAFVIWRPSKVAAKAIVPPPETSYATDVTPSISSPNAESDLKDIAMTATDLPVKIPLSTPGSTSPVVIKAAVATPRATVSVSQAIDEPTPVALMSISDFRMNDRKAVLPPVNQTAGSADGGAGQAADQPKKSILQGSEHQGVNAGEAGTAKVSTNKVAAAGRESGGRQDDPASPRGDGLSLLGSSASATVISLPKDGHFGAVVVGSSLEDRFPELEGLWSRRLVYTVYLHVGLAQNWILQYSLPREAEATAAGNVAHLEAPWPYSIVRPDLAYESLDAGALIVNGFINQDGRFEALRTILPVSFPQFGFVLHCLEQWQFRPGTQNGHPTRLEVMLIIPNQEE